MYVHTYGSYYIRSLSFFLSYSFSKISTMCKGHVPVFINIKWSSKTWFYSLKIFHQNIDRILFTYLFIIELNILIQNLFHSLGLLQICISDKSAALTSYFCPDLHICYVYGSIVFTIVIWSGPESRGFLYHFILMTVHISKKTTLLNK